MGVKYLRLSIPKLIKYTSILFLINNSKKKIYENCLTILILVFIFLFIITPFLWENPIVNFIHILNYFKNHPWPHYNFYFGEYIKASENPWHYIFIWILFTTPLIHLLTILIGVIVLLFKFNFLSNINKLYFLAISFFYLSIPIFLVILFNSTLYDGLRHFYFIFPFLVIFQIIGVSHIFLLKKNY